MKLLRHLLVAALLIPLLSACGQKGPLYLPEDNSSQAPAEPIEEEEDDDGA
jgi:predicted small lipoprotein YifL